jgi:hypothetical protein
MRDLKDATYTTKHCVKLTCDICGMQRTFPDYATDWSNKQYDVQSVSITYKHGTAFPEFHEITHETFDCCPDCFDKVIRPLFKTGPYVVKEES